MNTWGALAAHVTLIPGVGPAGTFGAFSGYSFALGASVTLLALVATRSARQLDKRWQPADLWQRVVRLSRALAGVRRNSRSRFRQRVDLLLLYLLGDDADGPSQSQPDAVGESRLLERQAEDGRPTRRVEPAGDSGATRGYRRKHRSAGRHAGPRATGS